MRQTKLEIGGYTVESELGRGGFGTVYSAVGRDGQAVALKVSNRSFDQLSTREVAWQQNEIEALLKLNHPGLVSIREYGFLEDRRLYFVMERITGVDLLTYLRSRGRLDALEALSLLRAVVDAVAVCHEAGILHLDLKPQNIIVVEPLEPVVKVLDFGLATLVSSWRSGSEGFAGTPEYMPPENLEYDVRKPTPSADLYAIGVILFELLAGRLPYVADSWMGMKEAKRYAPQEPLSTLAPEVPGDVSQLCEQLMAQDPSQRPTSMKELGERLKQLCHSLLGEHPQQEASEPVSRMVARDGPFVGRSAELDALELRWATALHRKGQACAIVATAGLGKSRLTSEFLNKFAGTSTLLGYGRCRQVGGLVPYSSIREAFAHIARQLSNRGRQVRYAIGQRLTEVFGDDVHLVSALVPEFASLFGPNNARDGRHSNLLGPMLIASMTEKMLWALGQFDPVLLVIEDLHWAGDGTLEVIAHVAASLPVRAMLLCTSRPSVRLPEKTALPHVELSSFSAADNDHLIEAMLAPIDGWQISALKGRVPLLTSGNPLFTTHVLQDLQMSGCVRVEPSGAHLDRERLDSYEPPESVSEVIGRLVERISARSRTILGVAALMGRRFSVDVLESLQLFARSEVVRALDEAEQHHLCRSTGSDATSLASSELGAGKRAKPDRVFAHDTIRERVESSLERGLLPELHRRIARELKVRGASRGTLAFHLEQAGEDTEAARAYVEAGLEAGLLHDPSMATRQLRSGLTLLLKIARDAELNELLARATFELVRLACQIGRTDDILSIVDEVAAVLGTCASLEQRLALQSAYARLHYVRGDFAQTVSYCNLCLSGVVPKGLQRYQLAPANILGRSLCVSGRFNRAVKLLERGCVLAEDVGDLVELCHSLGMLGLAMGFTGQLEGSQRHIQRSRKLAEYLKDPVRTLACYFYETTLCEFTYNAERGIQACSEGIAFADENGIGGLYLYLILIFAGRHQFHLGRLKRAKHILERALKLSGELHIQIGVGWVHGFMGDVHVVDGMLAEAEKAFQRAYEFAGSDTTDELAMVLALTGLGHVKALMGGDLDSVRSLFERSLRCAEANGNNWSVGLTLQRYAESLSLLGDSEASRSVMERHTQFFAELGLPLSDWWPTSPSPLVGDENTRSPLPNREFWQSVSRLAVSSAEELGDTAWMDELNANTQMDSGHPLAPDAVGATVVRSPDSSVLNDDQSEPTPR
ncbi:MAG: hypothetical protein CO108_24450 [Deltaproteobacteria bacterium CG_4_9_14_3_um_filter_63_12]|nr:MAG: hypothetical protein CO108_24450 [Deltaproteobacteria bacterium CG_4_9_14_3_um_filter_63_12]